MSYPFEFGKTFSRKLTLSSPLSPSSWVANQCHCQVPYPRPKFLKICAISKNEDEKVWEFSLFLFFFSLSGSIPLNAMLLSSVIKREISIMKLIIHPNVICLYEASKGRLKEDEARKYFQQLISRGVYHRDLK
ncbi:hypothetical protein V6Z12_A05G452400 [Gossypium hirsutum]